MKRRIIKMIKLQVEQFNHPNPFVEKLVEMDANIVTGTSLEGKQLGKPLDENDRKQLPLKEKIFLKLLPIFSEAVPSSQHVVPVFKVAKKGSPYRGATTDPKRKWENCQVPYVISNHFSGEERSIISSTMQQFEVDTGIKWIPKPETTDVPNYVLIEKGSRCESIVGKQLQPGWQILSLGEKGSLSILLNIFQFFFQYFKFVITN